MFRRFKRDRNVECPVVMLDVHSTSPPAEAPAKWQETSIVTASLFEQANRFYLRSRRPVRRKSAGII